MIPYHSEFPVHELVPERHSLLPCWEAEREPAARLFVQGRSEALELLERLPSDGLAVVGTRSPHPRSIQLTRTWIRDLAGTRRIVNSGFAIGIDTVAHQSAIEAGLPTIAFLGTPLDIDYPRGQRLLRKRILETGGLLISEYDGGTRTQKYHFRQRNRLIALFSKALLVVEAGESSGTLNTAMKGFEFQRRLFVVPCAPGDPRFAGNQWLLDQKEARPFWGPHCLGESWYELSGESDPPESADSGHAVALIEWIREKTYRGHGVPMTDAIAWAMSREWPAGEFFSWLEANLENGRILNHSGSLTAAGR